MLRQGFVGLCEAAVLGERCFDYMRKEKTAERSARLGEGVGEAGE